MMIIVMISVHKGIIRWKTGMSVDSVLENASSVVLLMTVKFVSQDQFYFKISVIILVRRLVLYLHGIIKKEENVNCVVGLV